MDKHKKVKGLHPRGASLDGIVTDGRRLGVPVTRSYQPRTGHQSPSMSAVMERSEGFYPLRSGTAALGQVAEPDLEVLDEPILLDEAEDKPKKKKRFFGSHRKTRRTILIILTILLAAALYFGIRFYITQKNLFRGGGAAPALSDCMDTRQLKKEGDCRVNILLLGIGGDRHSGTDLTDTIMLASIDPVNDKISLLSVPRDLWVQIEGNGNQKINAAYAYGKQFSQSKDTSEQKRQGIELIDKTLERILGVPIHYHAVMDFTAFKQMVDAVGGITVNVPETLYDPTIAWENNWNPTIAQKGVQEFDGAKALLYVKSRETSSDFARGERQRLVLTALKDKVFSAGTFSNPLKISQLLSTLGKHVYTDFSLADMNRLHKIISEVPSSSISSLDLVKEPNALVTTGNINGLSVVQPKAGLFNYDAIKEYVGSAFRDGQLAKENSVVAIYNATSQAGLATEKAKQLKSLGYQVKYVENAPKALNPAKTVVVDLTNSRHKFTKHYLQLRFNTQTRSNVPAEYGIAAPQDAQFVIILGQDANGSTQ